MRDRSRRLIVAALLLLASAHSLSAADIARADLNIAGVLVEVDRRQIVTAADVPSFVQTSYSGKTTGDLVLLGELTGPGIVDPITLSTAPGAKFAIPPLHTKGDYSLQNIRLVTAGGRFVQQATPSFASILVSDVLSTQVTVRQLSPDELRARGITLDPRNYEAYSYSIVMAVGTSTVEVPYVVLVDRRTHEVILPPADSEYAVPVPKSNNIPPRFQPPAAYPIVLSDVPEDVPFTPASPGSEKTAPARKPTIPATVVIPNGFGVLHDFFAVLLNVSNVAPADSSIELNSITAVIDAPMTLRIAKTSPSVGAGQPLPVVDKSTGSSILVAGAQGSGEWTLEALKPGTHTVNIEVRATYKAPNQPDTPLRGKLSASIVVSDPRFHVTFSHPDVTRADEPYSAYTFVTNLSPQSQTVRLDLSAVPACGQGYLSEICRADSGSGVTELTLAPGAMQPVVNRLKSRITGHFYAAASSATDAAVGVDVKLTMGVSESGIPLSPATLVMPWYARYLDAEFVDANLGLLGLGYSLATAPLNATTAKFPRVIRTDVFRRAQDIARAGQRTFVTRRDLLSPQPADSREALFNLALDLLDNVEARSQSAKTPELQEWDQLRRSEESGRRAAAVMARQLERTGLDGGKSISQFVDDFAAATAHRTPFLLAAVHATAGGSPSRPFALSLSGASTGARLDIPADSLPPGCVAAPCPGSSWIRTLPFAELTRFSNANETGELALVGRWKEDVRLSIVPQSDRFTVDLLFPDSADGAFLRTTFEVTGASAGSPVTFTIGRGSHSITVSGGSAAPVVAPVVAPSLKVVAAAQDLHLDDGGHIVSMLFNRPVTVADVSKLRDAFSITTTVDAAAYQVTRRNSPSQTFIPGAALQSDSSIVNISFDKALSTNASYSLAADAIVDAATGAASSFTGIVPRVDNNAAGGLLAGRLLRADNTPVEGAPVQLLCSGRYQYEVTGADGHYLFEFVPRDIDRGENGAYVVSAAAEGKYTEAQGTIRLPGKVQTVDLMFLGRGTADGFVKYSDGNAAANVRITISSPVFGQFRSGVTDSAGHYSISDLPVGPLTFVGTDQAGRTTYATNEIRTPGQLVTQDLLIQKATAAGTATVRVTVRRSDVQDPAKSLVANARVGVYSRGFGIEEATTDANGRYEFTRVPAGFVSILAADFSLTRESAAIDLEIAADSVVDQAIVLHVPSASDQPSLVTIQGTITRDDPLAPNDPAKDTPVPGAVLTIAGLASVTADAQGSYVFDGVPLAFGGVKSLQVFDPATGRRGSFVLPTLVTGSNPFSVRLRTAVPAGVAKMRVRLTGSRGEPVSGYRVLSPYFPPIEFTETQPGIYERANVSVPQQYDVWAVPRDTKGAYGEQIAHGSVRADFDGQIGIADLHLPGQGLVTIRLEVAQPCQTPPCYAPATGPVMLRYAVWDEVEQAAVAVERKFDPDPVTGVVTANAIPALQDIGISTIDHPAGFATGSTRLAYDGDSKSVTLRLSSMSEVSGRVLMHDLQTPVAGASVRLEGSVANSLPVTTKADGSFAFSAVAANQTVRAIAEVTQDGVSRTGFVDAKTGSGGVVGNLVLVLREQSSVEGRVVDSGGAAVPLARYWARELSWPYRTFGSQSDPLLADRNGHFIIGNVFAGAFRITAVSPDVQEFRGDYQGTIGFEGDTSQRNIALAIGGAGSGAVSVLVVNPQNAFSPVPNAEVSLLRGGKGFDFATTDANGIAVFDHVPAGTYGARGFSKALGRAGTSADFAIAAGATSNVTLTLEFRGIVSGSVHDPESVPPEGPVRGAAVTLQQPSLVTRASTDSSGTFEFAGIPEGNFTVDAFDVDSGRRASGPAGLFISKLYPERTGIQLELERTAALGVKVFLPDDAGNPGVLAPLCDVIVKQGDGRTYLRELQGNDLSFKRLFAREGFSIEARELGGDGRIAKASGAFPSGTYETSAVLTFPTSGSVQVTVRDASGAAVSDARVTITGGNRSATLYTGSNGQVSLDGFALGVISVQAQKGTVAASASGPLNSHSTPLVFTLNLGTTASIGGGVDAEGGGPSVGTHVSMRVTSRLLTSVLQLDTTTDSSGAYRFDFIPVGGTSVTLAFFGPDGVTKGATLTRTLPDSTTGVVDLGRIRIDATPPRIVSIDPPNNANNVSPNSMIAITLSESVPAQFLTGAWFQLVSTDDGRAVNAVVGSQPGAGGTFIVTLTAPDPAPEQVAAGQKYRLKSNVVYRVTVVAGIQDATGNALNTTVGTAFTTTNYTEPVITSIAPPVDAPLPQQTTFRVKFNKAIDDTSFAPGNGGVIRLEQLQSYRGAPAATIETSWVRDPVDASTLVIAPRTAIVESSFYRLTISGTRDTNTPQNVQPVPRTFDYFSFDTKKPVVTIGSPVPDGYPLIAGVAYTVTPVVMDEGSQTPAPDTASVDWFDAGGAFITRIKNAPFAYTFVAPAAQPDVQFTLKASATDLSGNTSASLASRSWNVAPNDPPKELKLTTDVASAYPGKSVNASISFSDEGLAVTVALKISGTQRDGSAWSSDVGSQKITRASVADAWPAAKFAFSVPANLKEGTATLTATATDAASKSSTTTASFEVLADAIAPSILSLLPNPETHFANGQTLTVEVKATDGESGVARSAITVGSGTPVTIVAGSTGSSFDASSGVWTFRTSIIVPRRNADTRVHITATVYDGRDNGTSAGTDVVYDRVNDPAVPVAAWITPLDGAALPSGQSSWLTTLRLKATGNVTQVTFSSSAMSAPVILMSPKSGTTDIYEASVPLTMPADGSSFSITATVSDGVPDHLVELPITIDPVKPDAAVVSNDLAITATNVSDFSGKSLLIRGAGARLFVYVPLTLKNLMVLDGALVGNPTQTKLDLTVGDRLFLDADSSMDVSGRGYLGGWATRDDGTGRNESQRGQTSGATTTGGALAAGSHGGSGGESPDLPTNAAYGSVSDAADFGAGGGGGATCCIAGGSGGGAIALRGGVAATDLSRVVIAGNIRADGESGVGRAFAGGGGSVFVSAGNLITGATARITANGGDDDAAANESRGGGGGRLSVTATRRFDVADLSMLQARGGRNGGASEGSTYTDGGAGTILIRRNSEPYGELIVSSLDSRYPSTSHAVRGTPLSGTLTFDSIAVVARALARFDSPYTVADSAKVKVDANALLLKPSDVPAIALTATAPQATVIQDSKLVTTFDASSIDGIDHVRAIFTGAVDSLAAFGDHPPFAAGKQITTTIPAAAAAGPANLKLRTVTRSGRVAESVPVPFTIVLNAVPVITKFDVSPTGGVYVGRTIAVSAIATDDVEVKSLALASTIGTVTAGSASIDAATHAWSQPFTVAIPLLTPVGSSVQLTITAADGYPDRTATTQSRSIPVLKDSIPPLVTLTAPVANQIFDEGANNTIAVESTASDAETGVKRVSVSIDGKTYDLAPAAGRPNVYTASVPVPNVDGTDLVPKTISVTASDFEGNQATSDPLTIRIRPLNDPNAPALSWTCASPGAVYPAGGPARLRVYAKGNTTANGVAKVEFFVGDPATVVTASAVAGVADNYEASITLPAGNDGTSIPIRAVATSVGGNSADLSTAIVLYNGTVFTSNASIAESDSQYDRKPLFVRGSGVTLTIAGHHEFTAFGVLDGAVVVHPATTPTSIQRLDISASAVFVSCDSRIDATGRGLAGSVAGIGYTYKDATGGTTTGGSSNGSGGSHGGRGGYGSVDGSAAAYGSLFDPNEPGGSGSAGTCSTCAAGGGIVRIAATTVSIDGTVTANGVTANQNGGGAGGSIRIDGAAVTGAGQVRANGGDDYQGGGGGRIAIYSQSLKIPKSSIVSSGGRGSYATKGTSGTIYLCQKDASGKKISDELIVDTTDSPASSRGTPLGSAGSGTVVASSGNSVTTSAPVPEWIEGSWLEILDASGAVMSTYRIVAHTPSTLTLDVPPGVTLSAPAGTAYRGIWRFDGITSRNYGALSADALRTPMITTTVNGGISASLLRNESLLIVGNVKVRGTIEAPQFTIDGGSAVEVDGLVSAQSLVIRNGSKLQQLAPAMPSWGRLTIKSNTISVDAMSSIDASGRGLIGTVALSAYTYKDATSATTTGGSYDGAGGSHGGRGGVGNGESAQVYGSLFDPDEPGGAGSGSNSPGGGVIRIFASSIALDGSVVANGVTAGAAGQGAGGSIRIEAASISGAGQIHADGAGYGRSGGGGRIAIYSDALSIPRANITAAGGSAGSATWRGAAGTVYFKRSDQPNGELIVDNLSNLGARATNLPSIGLGTITAVDSTTGGAADRLTDAAAAFAPNFMAHLRVFVGTDRANSWLVKSNDAKSLTLDTSALPFAASAGQSYRGLARFDSVRLRNSVLTSFDVIDATSVDKDAASSIMFDEGPPVFPTASRSQIVVSSTSAGDFVTGPSGAVVDTDTPVKLTATNTRTLAQFTSAAAADGSFRIAVDGAIGDSFTLSATDSHMSPLSSEVISVNGTIAEGNVIAGVTLLPATIVGGNAAIATVRLQNPARNGGCLVVLTGGDNTSIPSTVVVPQGVSAVQFSVNTTAVNVPSSAVITATLPSGSKSANLQLLPAGGGLASIAVEPSSVNGGGVVNGTVVLSAPAPSAGAMIGLTSSNPSIASLPASITVAAGATSASFPIATATVASSAAITISAFYGNTQSATLTVNACTTMAAPPSVSPGSGETIWIDDAVPSGATATGSAAFTTTYAATGTQSLQFTATTGARQWSMTGAAALNVTSSDRLIAYALIDPCNPPREILFAWSDGTYDYRASWGDDLIDATVAHTRVGTIPAGGVWTRLELLATTIGAHGHSMRGLTIKVFDGQVWFDRIGIAAGTVPRAAAPSSMPRDRVWFDDELPMGAVVTAKNSPFVWDSSQAASGSRAHHLAEYWMGTASYSFDLATEPMSIQSGDVIVTYVLVHPLKPTREVMLEFIDETGSAEHRAYWGENALGGGTDGTSSRVHIGPVPEPGVWTRLEIPASLVGLEGHRVRGMSFDIYGGDAWFDHTGAFSRANVAAAKTATQSSNYSSQTIASRAVDGVTSGAGEALVAMTASEASPWWQVDLGSVQPVEHVVIWNRTDCCSSRLQRFWLFASEQPFSSTTIAATRAQAGVSSFYCEAAVGTNYTFRISRSARFLRVQLVGTDVLQLAELQAFAPSMAQPSNIAAGASATQSTSSSSGAERAVDGNPDGTAPTLAETGNATMPWWQVDLGSVQPISFIDVWNRAGCCVVSTPAYYLFVSDTPFTSNDPAQLLLQPGVTPIYVGSTMKIVRQRIGRTGRYVRLAATGSGNLAIGEVQVWTQQPVLAPLARDGKRE